MPDLKPWLEELYKAGSLTDEEKKLLDGVLAKEAVQKFVGESVLRQSDYSRKMNEMSEKEKTLQTQVEEKQKALDSQVNQLADWRDKEVLPKVQKLDKELAEAKLKLWKHEQAIAKAKSDYNLTDQDLGLEPGAPTPQPKPPENAPDLSGYVKREDYDALLAETQRTPFITAEMEDIALDYKDLFGKDLRGRTELLAQAVAAHRKDPNVKLRQFIEEKYEFAKRRDEVAKERQAEHDKKIREEERAKVLSEHKLPVMRPAPDQMPQLPKPAEVIEKERIGRNRDASSLEEIVSVYNTGKYKEARPGST